MLLQETVRVAPPPHPGRTTLDEPHLAVWLAIRHLFPARAMATPVDHGCLLVSWTIDALTCSHFAAPVLIRIDSGLLLALWACEPHEREAIAREQEPVVRAHLAGYDPHSRVPTCPVIVLGE